MIDYDRKSITILFESLLIKSHQLEERRLPRSRKYFKDIERLTRFLTCTSLES
jgi:hypothetical protein